MTTEGQAQQPMRQPQYPINPQYAQPQQVMRPVGLNPQPIPPQQPQVVIQQVQMQQPVHNKKFHHNLLNCCSAGGVNCLGAFLGCSSCLVASARNNYDSSNCVFNWCCVSEPAARNIIREGYGINGSCAEDVLVGICCAPCNAIQLVSEVRERGSVKGPVRQQM